MDDRTRFVRVKAGSPNYEDASIRDGKYFLMPRKENFGVRLTVDEDKGDQVDVTGVMEDAIAPEYLEPWNDAEEWNGSEWVAKKTPVTMYRVINVDARDVNLDGLETVNVNGVTFTRVDPERPTLRDLLAMAALQGLLSRAGGFNDPAAIAYRHADAMLRSRQNGTASKTVGD